jgi:hypothetical protein
LPGKQKGKKSKLTEDRLKDAWHNDAILGPPTRLLSQAKPKPKIKPWAVSKATAVPLKNWTPTSTKVKTSSKNADKDEPSVEYKFRGLPLDDKEAVEVERRSLHKTTVRANKIVGSNNISEVRGTHRQEFTLTLIHSLLPKLRSCTSTQSKALHVDLVARSLAVCPTAISQPELWVDSLNVFCHWLGISRVC